jgi:uncharacterized protein YfcZ (UPF0381/DUF406 family)
MEPSNKASKEILEGQVCCKIEVKAVMETSGSCTCEGHEISANESQTQRAEQSKGEAIQAITI